MAKKKKITLTSLWYQRELNLLVNEDVAEKLVSEGNKLIQEDYYMAIVCGYAPKYLSVSQLSKLRTFFCKTGYTTRFLPSLKINYCNSK